jgi:hypothetical protein
VTVLALALLAAVASDHAEVRAGAREPIAVIVWTPTPEAGRVRSSALIAETSRLLDRYTRFRSINVEPSMVRECGGRLGCLAYRIEADGSGARQLLLITQVTNRAEPDRLSATLVDLHDARGLGPNADRARADEVEADLAQRALRTERQAVVDEGGLGGVLQGWFGGPFAQVFGLETPFGTIALGGLPATVNVLLDGALLAAATGPVVHVRDVTPGAHLVEVEDELGGRFGKRVLVEAGVVLPVEVTIEHTRANDVVRVAVGVSGALATLAGAGFLLLAATRADDSVRTVCFAGVPDCSTGSALQTFGFSTSSLNPGEAVNPPGLTPVGLGAGLAAGGLTWLGTALLGDEPLPTWLGVGAGLVVGVGTVLLVGALDGPHPTSGAP